MKTCHIQLNNSKNVRLDKSGHSWGYFCQKSQVTIDQQILKDLKKVYYEQSGKNIRLCLHKSPKSLFHDMIIFEGKKGIYAPHYHPNKTESLQILEGTMAIAMFDKNDKIQDVIILNSRQTFMYSIGPKIVHMTLPLTDLIIYRETKQGPFKNGDNQTPSWFDTNNKKQVGELQEQLHQAVNLNI